MKRLAFILWGILLFGVPEQGWSQYYVQESFDYAQGAALDSLIGPATGGWGSSWHWFDLQSGVFHVQDSGMAYSDLSFPIHNIGGHVSAVNPTAWGGERIGRYLGKKWPNQSGKIYWLSYLLQLSPDFTSNGWAGVSFFDSTSELTGIGHGWGSDSLGVWTGTPQGKSQYTCQNGIQWLVAKIVMQGDSMSRVYMWVSPDPAGAEPDTANADARDDWNWHAHTGFNRIVVHCGGQGVGMSMAVDEIRLGETWSSVSSVLTSISQQGNTVPDRFEVAQNYPNPFNPSTTISFSLPSRETVSLKIFDVMGREIASLVSETMNAGTYARQWDAQGVSSGVYYYQFKAGKYSETRKLVVLK